MTRSWVIVTTTVELLPPASPDQPRNLWSTDGAARFVTSAELGYRFESGVVTTDPIPSTSTASECSPGPNGRNTAVTIGCDSVICSRNGLALRCDAERFGRF